MSMSQECRDKKQRIRLLEGMIDRRLDKKSAREEELKYVEHDIKRLEAYERGGEKAMGEFLFETTEEKRI